MTGKEHERKISRKRKVHARAFMICLIMGLSLSFSASFARNNARPAPVNYESLKETVSRLIKKEMKQNDVVGLSIALVDDQEVVWAEGFGFADEKNRVPAAPETVYRIGFLTNSRGPRRSGIRDIF
jgi:CubicO group peptidase (beta-lactamase class C family)